MDDEDFLSLSAQDIAALREEYARRAREALDASTQLAVAQSYQQEAADVIAELQRDEHGCLTRGEPV
jgi:hypothetical protein